MSSQIEISLSAIAVTCCEFILCLLTPRTEARACERPAAACGGELVRLVMNFHAEIGQRISFHLEPTSHYPQAIPLAEKW